MGVGGWGGVVGNSGISRKSKSNPLTAFAYIINVISINIYVFIVSCICHIFGCYQSARARCRCSCFHACVCLYASPPCVPLTVVCVLQSRSRPLTSGHRDRSNIWCYGTAVGTGEMAKFKAAPHSLAQGCNGAPSQPEAPLCLFIICYEQNRQGFRQLKYLFSSHDM